MGSDISSTKKTSYKLNVALGNYRQHVGELYGNALRNEVRKALYQQCPNEYGRGVCRQQPATFGKIAFSEVLWKKGTYKTRGYMILEVKDSNCKHLYVTRTSGLANLLSLL
jgi:hypothetical protein